MKFWFITALVGLGSVSSAFSEGSTTNAITEKKAAIVKIWTMESGVESSSGTGFFVSPEGWLVTNTHVVVDSLRKGWDAVFELADGTRYSSSASQVEWGRCEVNGLNDLCLVKLLKYKPKAWFNYSTAFSAAGGTPLYAYGHPKGLDFSISEGVLSSYRKFDFPRQKIADATTVGAKEVVQTTVPLNGGNSGGPIFDKAGNLIAVSTFSMNNAEGIHFGISRNELAKFIGSNPTFITNGEFQKKVWSELNERSRAAAKRILTAYATVNEKELGLIEYGSSLRLKFLVPKEYIRCEPVEAKELLAIHCRGTDPLLRAEMRINVGMAEDTITAASFDQKIPTVLNEGLHRAGKWEKVTAKLTQKEIEERFFSRNEPATCSGSPKLICSAAVVNFMEAGTYTAKYYIQFVGTPLVVAFTMVAPQGDAMKEFAHAIAEGATRAFGVLNEDAVLKRTQQAIAALPKNSAQDSSSAQAPAPRRSTASAYLTQAEIQSRTQFTGTCRKPFLFKEKGAPKYWSYLFALEGSGQFVPVHDYRNLSPGTPPQCTSTTSVSGTWEDDPMVRSTRRRVLGVR